MFCDRIWPKYELLFIVDQANALDHLGDESKDRHSNEKKSATRELLDKISLGHLKLATSSANYQAGQGGELRDCEERQMTVYEGLSKYAI